MIDDMEVIVFKVITASGIAKGLAYKALDKVENRDLKVHINYWGKLMNILMKLMKFRKV